MKKNGKIKRTILYSCSALFILLASIIYTFNMPYCVTSDVRGLFRQEKIGETTYSQVLEILNKTHYFHNDYEGGMKTVFVCRGSIRAWDSTSIVVKHDKEKIIDIFIPGWNWHVKNLY